MKVKILLYPKFGSTNIQAPWLYFGSNIQFFQIVQSQTNWVALSLAESIQFQKEYLIPKVLKFVKELGLLNKNSLSWEMTQLAGRNNLESPFFLSVVQLSAIIQFILKYNVESTNELVVVCEDCFLAKSLSQSLKTKKVKVGFPFFAYFLDQLFEVVYSIAYFLFQLGRQVRNQFKYSWQAKLTRNQKRDFSNDKEVLLFHLCLTEKNILSDGKLTCNYFTSLLDYLESKGKNIVRIPWLFSVKRIPLQVTFAKLRESGSWIPEDYLGLFDYLSSFMRSIFSSFSLLKRTKFDGLNVTALLDREFWLHFRSSPNLNSFYKYYFALKESFPSAKLIRSYDHFENMPFEKVIPFYFRSQKGLDFLQIGYHHSLVSNDFWGYHLFEGEEYYKHFPDFIITNGSIETSRYLQKPIDKKRIISGPSLRQKFASQEGLLHKRKEQLAILLSMDIGASVEILTYFSKLDSYFVEKGIQVILRTHPLLPMEVLEKKIANLKIPEHWKVSKRDLYDDLFESKFAAVMASASIIDAVLAGCIPIPVRRLLDFDWNGLDFLSEKHRILHSVSGEKLKDHFLYLDSMNPVDLEKEIKAVLNSLYTGINTDEKKLKDMFLI
ncbi:hypothetical protein ND861_10990 [Leptospira sp. 2 VSF19]|uniref:Uncharacterized protein n=1 Tax=Leptospira soteropolitanensis TaxID=2950025 RepID=A0AAW5VNM1_9LEPT|nr:hypothetical protein [Leptospira soteropolitanensis]MCW7493172.1 hypothetical protein [Leptospira soteropolitanensis]MCW7500759.1 hypothetical protein [Leptospira soteropolitanensis]MCW7523022.1 hypothetical protein [Leptospira soteropolitanensis]MCW7526871.1 hypothetical protein [Leptospira soteropolitanensis]MCW7530740.1 hypothetical protein [Leptospira soteropolitanensis]